MWRRVANMLRLHLVLAEVSVWRQLGAIGILDFSAFSAGVLCALCGLRFSTSEDEIAEFAENRRRETLSGRSKAEPSYSSFLTMSTAFLPCFVCYPPY